MNLVAHNIHKVYSGTTKKVTALDGVDLELVGGESLGIVGPSGAGKSTLMHIIGGLDSPNHGKVLMDTADIYKLPDSARAAIRNERVGFVFQFYHLLPEFTALENVMLPALIKGIGGSGYQDIMGRAKEILKGVGLSHRMEHRPTELSGGEAQRVAIARALVNSPDILLCDEPTGNLDSRSGEAILDLLFDIKSDSGISLVIVTHDERISSRTKRTVHLRDGKAV
jgi:lipoprotein-releasing system ATP-binding protein